MDKSAAITNPQIVTFLSSTTVQATFLQKIKIKYRPYVCPFDELLGFAQPGMAVYDIGCGSGQFCALLANFTSAKTIKGIEIDRNLVRNANEIAKNLQGKNMSFSYFSGIKIPSDISKYDLIYMIDVYHHIPTLIRDDFMRQVYKKMKPGARLVFKDIDAGSPFIPFNKLHDLIFAKEFPKEISFYRATQFLTDLGFKIVGVRKKRIFVYPHYFILVQK